MSKVDHAIEELKAAGFTLIFASRPEQATATDAWGRPARPQALEIRLDLADLLQFPKTAFPIVFLYRNTLSETDFQYMDYNRDAKHYPAPVTVDLLALEPTLKRFKQHLYEPSEVEFFAPYNGLLMTCSIRENWYGDFLDLRQPAEAQAAEQLAREVQARREAQAAQEQAELRPHEQRIRLLFDDGGFLKLARTKSTAQRTLLSYAKQKEPEAAAALGDDRMKELLAELRDWVLMQGARK